MAGDWDGEVDRRRALLRQLRDLDDDLAAGKLTEEDHRRLSEPIEHEAAMSLTRRPARTATVTRRRAGDPDHRPGGGADSDDSSTGAADSDEEPDSDPAGSTDGAGTAAGSGRRLVDAVGLRRPGAGTTAARRQQPAATARRGPRTTPRATPRPARSRVRRIVLAVVAVAAVAGVTALLANTITPRGAGQTVTGSGPAAVATAPPVGPTGGSAAAPAGPSAGSSPSLSEEQAATIAAAEIDVKAHPKDVSKHLTLAQAYADGGITQLAAVEYLAILKLDPSNAEANTALAQLAFESGQSRQAKAMLDRALKAHPNYPEALYARGVVLFSGLHQPAAAARDLRAYLAAAPFGSNRTQAETLLALAGSQK
jgi:cytochrome c-type biogenesis protein CcmH/NrfG